MLNDPRQAASRLRKNQAKPIHCNSQTLQVKLENQKGGKSKKEIEPNQSENVLSKLQNLLVTNGKQDQKSKSKAVVQQYNAGKYLTNSNTRKQAHSIGSLGRSNTRYSRYS